MTPLELVVRQYVAASLVFGQIVADLLKRGGPDGVAEAMAKLPPELQRELLDLDEAMRWGRVADVDDLVAVLTAQPEVS